MTTDVDFPSLHADAVASVLSHVEWSQQLRFATVAKLWHANVSAQLFVEDLNLRPYASTLTDAVLSSVARRCPLLKSINLAGARSITSEGVATLNACQRLESINLSCGPKVSATALEKLALALPSLQSLDLGGCLGSELSEAQLVSRFGRYLELEDEDGLNQVQG